MVKVTGSNPVGTTNAPLAKLVKAALSKGVLCIPVRVRGGVPKIWKCGRVRFIAPVLKTDDQKWSVSSNLTASASLKV